MTFGAAAIILYLAAFVPWSSSRARTRSMKRTNAFREPIATPALADDVSLLSGISFLNSSGSSTTTGKIADIPDPVAVVTTNPSAEALWNATAIGTGLNLLQGNVAEMCRLLLPEGAETVAIVGNGPLTDKSRAAIAEADMVLRFNALNNRLPGENLGMWAVRANYRPEAPYWGFWQLRKGGKAASVVAAAMGVMLLGGNADQAVPLLHSYPALLGKTYHVETATYSKMYREVFSGGRDIKPYPPDPSTGLLGLIQVLACYQRRGCVVHLDLYGFNWSTKHWETHMVKAERHIVKRLLQGHDFTVNPTACDGLRSCDSGCDRPEYVLQYDGTGKACASKG